MRWLQQLLNAWRQHRYATRFYRGYAYATRELYEQNHAPEYKAEDILERMLEEAAAFGNWDAFEDGVHAALCDYDARARAERTR